MQSLKPPPCIPRLHDQSVTISMEKDSLFRGSDVRVAMWPKIGCFHETSIASLSTVWLLYYGKCEFEEKSIKHYFSVFSTYLDVLKWL